MQQLCYSLPLQPIHSTASVRSNLNRNFVGDFKCVHVKLSVSNFVKVLTAFPFQFAAHLRKTKFGFL